ncbi:MAG: hypothetical protein NW226_18015 [Microscillaceae bacterium]|nr:hypothetical protein [Microscillaceae bacterium]
MSMEIRQFRRMYDLELIPASHSGIILGTLVWDAAIFGKPKFDGHGMPKHIMIAFEDAGYITQSEMTNYINDLSDEPLNIAGFADRNIDASVEIAVDMEIPEVNKFKSDFSHPSEIFI